MEEENYSDISNLRLQESEIVNLSDGVLCMYEPSFKNLQQQLTELTNKQNQLINEIETVSMQLRQMENEELKEMKRALQLHQRKQKEALEREHQREANLKMEQELIAKPNRKLL